MNNLNDVTIVIKTFIRNDRCQNLLDSIRKYYPTVPVVIVNDGDDRKVWEDEYTKTVLMPFDSGVTAGRNEGVRNVDTEYVVVCDDDFVFNERTDLQKWKSLLNKYDLDLLCADLQNHPFWKWSVFTDSENKIETMITDKGGAAPIKDLGEVIVVDIALNFILAKTQTLLDCPWPGNKKTREHGDFFAKYSDIWTVGFTKLISAYHDQGHNDQRYTYYRQRTSK